MSQAFHLLELAILYTNTARLNTASRKLCIERARFYLAMSRNYPSPSLPK